MPITAHLSKHRAEIRMPHTDGVDPETGATSEGDVLTGKFSVKDAIQRDADRSARWDNMRTPCAAGDCDPVLRRHLRIIPESGE